MVVTANLGFPRMGAARELKFALERHWRGDDPEAADLAEVAAGLRARHWRLQVERGIGRVPVGDASLYDHVLDTAVTFGAVPERFAGTPAGLGRYFALARGAARRPALELTKWFDTNYHYLVPELAADQGFAYADRRLVDQWREASVLGVPGRAVVLGPVTFLRLSKRTDGGDPLELLDALLPAYEALLADLVAAGVPAVQLDEPLLVTDLDAPAVAAYERAYPRLRAAAPAPVELTVATYFGGLGDNTALALDLPVDVVHVDLVRAPGQLGALLERVPDGMSLSLGLVDGRNIWRADLASALAIGERAVAALGPGRVQVAPSCSLLHLPVDVAGETGLDDELRSWLAFAVQRLDEVAALGAALSGAGVATTSKAFAGSASAVASRRTSSRVRSPEVRARAAAVTPDMARRSSPYADRQAAQRKALELPLLPTTTIGSFPQTAEVRALRTRHRRGELSAADYEAALEAETARCVRAQEDLGLDLLVHGELERTDMVEYFGAQLDGFATSSNGWVQSYGSRCVKPPILYGDVARPEPMTVRWSTYAAGLTDKPMKGMLTGPVTILCWSFVRDDQPWADTARQVALVLRDEVADLAAAGLRAIQIDEPALREGLPLRRADHAGYLAWAAEAFRLTSSGVADEVQVHTHMCYAEFGDILDAIVALDADVISMEASRSRMALLDELSRVGYPNEIGPGVWDIHSPRVPSGDEIDDLLGRALKVFGADRLWVNPDCGLKTRDWPEVRASLTHMVAAARRARARLA